MWSWILHVIGADDTTGKWYAFWSGFGSDLGELGIISVIVQWYRKHTCHVDGCYRLGHLPVQGTAYHTCKRHHPTQGIKHSHILEAHETNESQIGEDG